MSGAHGELRIGLTISGAIALGAFEGGALAALLAGAQAVNEVKAKDALRIDVIAGASAGSITGLLTARTLHAGLDPIDVMYESWVVTPQLERITDGLQSPLSVESTRAIATKLLEGRADPDRVQSTPIELSMAIGCLRGLEYEIGRIGGSPMVAGTHLDWAEFTVEGGEDVPWYAGEPLSAALASGAHAAAFPPIGLDRGPRRAAYVANGIRNFPPSDHLWYTDGGTIDNQPLGRALDLAQKQDGGDRLGDASRLHLLITPDPIPAEKGDDEWSRPDPRPPWTRTALRAAKLARSQRLYDDLRQLEKTNSRIEWVRLLHGRLLAIIEGREADAEAALAEATAEIGAQKEALTGPADLRSDELEPDSDLSRALRTAMDVATGLAKKRNVAVAVVSPLTPEEVSGEPPPPRGRLAGEFLGHFGGFLQQDLREHDFALGYRCMLAWMGEGDGLARNGLAASLSVAAVAGAEGARAEWFSRHGREWRADLGEATLSDLPLSSKLRLYGVAARSALIAFRQVTGRA